MSFSALGIGVLVLELVLVPVPVPVLVRCGCHARVCDRAHRLFFFRVGNCMTTLPLLRDLCANDVVRMAVGYCIRADSLVEEDVRHRARECFAQNGVFLQLRSTILVRRVWHRIRASSYDTTTRGGVGVGCEGGPRRGAR